MIQGGASRSFGVIQGGASRSFGVAPLLAELGHKHRPHCWLWAPGGGPVHAWVLIAGAWSGQVE